MSWCRYSLLPASVQSLANSRMPIDGQPLHSIASGTTPRDFDGGGQTMARQREFRRSSSLFTRGFAASIQAGTGQASVLGMGSGALPVLQVHL